MKPSSLITLFLILIVPAVSSAGNSSFIKGKGFRGYVFDKSYSYWGSSDRYTPTASEIKQAESLLKKKIHEINQPRVNQGNGCPEIDKKLNRYVRQYFGYLNQKGERIISINCIWDKEVDSLISRDIIGVKDGCSYYWSVEINLTTNEIYSLDINGYG